MKIAECVYTIYEVLTGSGSCILSTASPFVFICYTYHIDNFMLIFAAFGNGASSKVSVLQLR